jgi:hypothetical protein
MGAAAILQLVLTYGPSVVSLIQTLVAKIEAGGTLTVADVEAEFATLKPYAAYGVALATTPPTAPPVAATPTPTTPPTP